MIRPRIHMLALLLVAGCAGRAADSSVVAPIVVPVAVSKTSGSSPVPAAPAPTPIVPHAPDGYVPMTVASITPQGSGASVELVSPSQKVVQIFVGGTEGHSLLLRTEKRAPERPLTHDLLDSVLRELNAEVVQAQVDELRGGTFIGTLVLRQENRVIKIDARPSDAIALAIGAQAPIYMAKRVIREAGTTHDDDDSAQPTRKP